MNRGWKLNVAIAVENFPCKFRKARVKPVIPLVSQARPNQPQRGSLSVSRTENDPRWGWLGLACETIIPLGHHTGARVPREKVRMTATLQEANQLLTFAFVAYALAFKSMGSPLYENVDRGHHFHRAPIPLHTELSRFAPHPIRQTLRIWESCVVP